MLVEAQQAFPEAWVGRTKDCRENRRAWDSSGCRHAAQGTAEEIMVLMWMRYRYGNGCFGQVSHRKLISRPGL